MYQLFLFASQSAGNKADQWNQAITKLVLKPGQSFKGGFQFRWAKDYNHMRDLLYESGGFDIRVIPGMTVPRNLPVRVAIRTQHPIDSILSDNAKVSVSAVGKNKGYLI